MCVMTYLLGNAGEMIARIVGRIIERHILHWFGGVVPLWVFWVVVSGVFVLVFLAYWFFDRDRREAADKSPVTGESPVSAWLAAAGPQEVGPRWMLVSRDHALSLPKDEQLAWIADVDPYARFAMEPNRRRF